MSLTVRRCSYHGCTNDKRMKELTFFHFPVNPERRSLWIANCKSDRFQAYTNKQINGFSVCKMHFAPACFNNILQNSITRLATPTLDYIAPPKKIIRIEGNNNNSKNPSDRSVQDSCTSNLSVAQSASNLSAACSASNLSVAQSASNLSAAQSVSNLSAAWSVSNLSAARSVSNLSAARSVSNLSAAQSDSNLAASSILQLREIKKLRCLLEQKESCIKKLTEKQCSLKIELRRKANQISYWKSAQQKALHRQLKEKDIAEGARKYLSESAQTLFEMQLIHRYGQAWSREEKKLALSMHSKSPYLYKCLRETHEFVLPSTSRLESWNKELYNAENAMEPNPQLTF